MTQISAGMWYQTGPLIKHKLAFPQGQSTIRGIADDVKLSPRQAVQQKKDAFFSKKIKEPKTPEEMIKDLQRRYGSVLRAIRKVYDIRDGRLSFREFCISYDRLGYSREVRSVWFLLDKNLSGDISLEELDPEAFRLLKYFYEALTQKYGSWFAAWRNCLDREGREVVPFRVFLPTVQDELGITHDEAALLFNCLDLNSLGTISYDEIVFLDDWAVAERNFAKRRGVRWVNRDPTGIVDWHSRPDVGAGSAAPREISMVPQVGHHQGSMPPIDRNPERRGSESARALSLSPRIGKMSRMPGQALAPKIHTGRARLQAVK